MALALAGVVLASATVAAEATVPGAWVPDGALTTRGL